MIGNVSLVSDRRIAAALAAAVRQDALAFRSIVDCGAGRDAAGAIAGLADDPETTVIAVSLKEIPDGTAFIAALAKARAAGKPVVILKSGLARDGALANAAWEAVLREHAAIGVGSHHELLGLAFYLASLGPSELPRGPRVAIVTFGGGAGVLATDECGRLGLQTPLLGAATQERVRPLVPPIASIANPIDLTPQMHQPEWIAKYVPTIEQIASDPQIDTMYLSFGVGVLGPADIARSITEFKRLATKTVIVTWTNAPEGGPALLAAEGIFPFKEPGDALSALRKIVDHARAVALPPRRPAGAMSLDWPVGLAEAEAGRHVLAALGVALAGSDTRLGALQLRIAAHRDPVFGPMVGCGAGGQLAELIDDATLERAPFDAATALAVLRRLQVVERAPTFDPAASIDGLAALLSKVSQFAAGAPWRQFTLQLDPVAWANGAAVVNDSALSLSFSS